MELSSIIEAIWGGRVRISDHSDEEATDDRLTFEEIEFSVTHGEIIEDYPDDKPFPSCLVYGPTAAGDPVHTVWAYNKQQRWAVLVTVYRPNPQFWVEGRRRTKS